MNKNLVLQFLEYDPEDTTSVTYRFKVDPKSPSHTVNKLLVGTHERTHIVTYRLSWPRGHSGQLSENIHNFVKYKLFGI